MIATHGSAPTAANSRGARVAAERPYGEVTGNPVEVFKAAHGGKFTRSGTGERANCPACDDRNGALVVSEADGWLRAHCFKCSAGRETILAAVGLRLRDVGPPRSWPESPDERRKANRALRESGWRAALSVLAREASVVQIAGRQLAGWQVLSLEDDARLALAVVRIDAARAVLSD